MTVGICTAICVHLGALLCFLTHPHLSALVPLYDIGDVETGEPNADEVVACHSHSLHCCLGDFHWEQVLPARDWGLLCGMLPRLCAHLCLLTSPC